MYLAVQHRAWLVARRRGDTDGQLEGADVSELRGSADTPRPGDATPDTPPARDAERSAQPVDSGGPRERLVDRDRLARTPDNDEVSNRMFELAPADVLDREPSDAYQARMLARRQWARSDPQRAVDHVLRPEPSSSSLVWGDPIGAGHERPEVRLADTWGTLIGAREAGASGRDVDAWSDGCGSLWTQIAFNRVSHMGDEMAERGEPDMRNADAVDLVDVQACLGSQTAVDNMSKELKASRRSDWDPDAATYKIRSTSHGDVPLDSAGSYLGVWIASNTESMAAFRGLAMR